MKCRNCNKEQGEHNSKTQECPFGKKHRTFGHTSYGPTKWLDKSWKDISTAPRDGTFVRVLCPCGEDVAYFHLYYEGDDITGEWSSRYGYGAPTHWKHLKGSHNDPS